MILKESILKKLISVWESYFKSELELTSDSFVMIK